MKISELAPLTAAEWLAVLAACLAASAALGAGVALLLRRGHRSTPFLGAWTFYTGTFAFLFVVMLALVLW